MKTTFSMRVVLLCVYVLVVFCGSTMAQNQNWGNQFGQFGNQFVGVVKNAWNTVEGAVENVVDKDLNKDGQIGKFRSQEDNANVRQVGGDPRAGGRFQVNRPRGGRALSPEQAVATPNLRRQ